MEISLLPKEKEHGNVEYKLKLDPDSRERFDHLVTQLKWRLGEGGGEAIFFIGVTDKGRMVGISEAEMKRSLDVLRKMAGTVDAGVAVVKEIDVSDSGSRDFLPRSCKTRKVCKALVTKKHVQLESNIVEVRVAILGATGSGKSSFLGVLTGGVRDNGQGRARLGMLRHRHEIKTGQTSSISHQMIGFSSSGEVLTVTTVPLGTWEAVSRQAAKIITFLDTCGDRKYLKTTVSGLTGKAPDYACVLVDSSASELDDVTKELFSVAHVLLLPTFIVLTKIDLVTSRCLKSKLCELFTFIGQHDNLSAHVVQTASDIALCAESCLASKVVPILFNSAVNGDHMQLLYEFFNSLPVQRRFAGNSGGPFVCQINEIYSVADAGLVLSGIVFSGRLDLASSGAVMLGPDSGGRFYPISVTSIHRQKQAVKVANSGDVVTCAISFAGNVHPEEKHAMSRGVAVPERPNRRLSKREKRQKRFESSLPENQAWDFDESGVGENQGTFFWSSSASPPSSSYLEPVSRPSVEVPFKLRKGIALIDSGHPSFIYRRPTGSLGEALSTQAVLTFETELTAISCSFKQGLRPGIAGYLHIGSIRQWATIIAINPQSTCASVATPFQNTVFHMQFSPDDILQAPKNDKKRRRFSRNEDPEASNAGGHLAAGETGKVWFRFDRDCEFLEKSWTVLFRHTGFKCVGKVTKLSGVF